MSMPALIPPVVHARLRHLRLVSQRVSATQGIGQQASRARGSGLEFAQYRAYEPGDEPRQIDWKLYARSDKFFVRESERDSRLVVWVLLDVSASMAQSDATQPQYTRLQAAKIQAACVVELACRQGDRFGLIAIGDGRLQVVEAGNGARHRDQCLHTLARLQAAGIWPDENATRPVWQRVHASDLALLISDGFDEKALALLERLAAARREVLTIQLLTAEEREFRFPDSRCFVDVESGEQLRTDAPAARAEYLQAFAEARAQFAHRLTSAGIRYAVSYLDEPPDAPLQALFAHGKARLVQSV